MRRQRPRPHPNVRTQRSLPRRGLREMLLEARREPVATDKARPGGRYGFARSSHQPVETTIRKKRTVGRPVGATRSLDAPAYRSPALGRRRTNAGDALARLPSANPDDLQGRGDLPPRPFAHPARASDRCGRNGITERRLPERRLRLPRFRAAGGMDRRPSVTTRPPLTISPKTRPSRNHLRVNRRGWTSGSQDVVGTG